MQSIIVRWFTLVLIAALSSPAAWPASTHAVHASPTGAPSPSIPSRPHTEREQRIVGLAYGIYEGAGIELPDVDIRFHDGLAACFGNSGFYRGWTDRPDIIDVCSDPDGLTDPDIRQTRTLWHELAHAHLELRPSESDKRAFLELLELDSWSSGEWHGRGSEYAAEILVWGITGGSYKAHSALATVDCSTRAAALSVLTDVEPHDC